MPFLKNNGESLFYHIQNEDLLNTGSNDVILFLHSLGADHRFWKYQLDDLEGMEWVAIAPVARGHGNSTWNRGISLNLWTDDILQLIDFLGIQKVVICGLSMGGVQALSFAQQFPERVRGLILADTFAKIEKESVSEKIRLTGGITKELGMDEYANHYLDLTLSHSFTAQVMRNPLRESIEQMDVTAYQESAEACFTVDLEGGLKELNIPTLVLIGEDDQKTPISYSKVITKNIPNSKLVVIPQARHLANVDQPKEFNRLLNEFLSVMQNKSRRYSSLSFDL
ncbi:alpha/beta fold hydrolase [Pseudalkalibacillus sp. R45]|uniref:alpha/beta fold hydrolase n=1 Tax=Pseudalkalibacillus sp. R45 TaxID=3457433 RepID=UPI003FCC5A37